jgi:zeaxanthin glucosyltransferase
VREVKEKISALGIDFWSIWESGHPLGSLPQSLVQLGRLSDVSALRFTTRAVAKASHIVCRDAPAAIRDAGVEALLVDQTEPAGILEDRRDLPDASGVRSSARTASQLLSLRGAVALSALHSHSLS